MRHHAVDSPVRLCATNRFKMSRPEVDSGLKVWGSSDDRGVAHGHLLNVEDLGFRVWGLEFEGYLAMGIWHVHNLFGLKI